MPSSSSSSTTTSTINNISNRINKLFRNPHINFFIIMNIILLITCYTFVASPVKNIISNIISHPVVILFMIIIIIVIGYFDINIAVLLLILFFIALYGFQGIYTNTNTNTDTNDNNTFTRDGIYIENFTSKPTDNSKNTKHNTKTKTKTKSRSQDTPEPTKLSTINNNINLHRNADTEKSRDTTVKNIKNVIFKTLNNFRNSNDNDYKNALLENKQKMFKNEKQNNNYKNKLSTSTSNEKFDNVASTNKDNENDDNDNEDNENDDNDDNDNTHLDNKKSSRSNFQTIKHRTFDPSLEEDTNLLITKEILQDMTNRIEYNYENTNYLKKYIKHRVEEIVTINKLLEDD